MIGSLAPGVRLARQQHRPSRSHVACQAVLDWPKSKFAALSLAGALCLAPPALSYGEITTEVTAVQIIQDHNEKQIQREGRNRQVYMTFSINDTETDKVVIELFSDVPLGSQRFLDLCAGRQGVSYRRSKIAGVGRGLVQAEPLRALTYGPEETTIAGGEAVADLQTALARHRHSHRDGVGMVSIIVAKPEAYVPTERLVAVDGRIISVKSVDGDAPNGTAFVITTEPNTTLDDTNLVVGQVVSGIETVERISRLPAVKDNRESAFYRVAKAAGDKRAVVAAKGFNKPFARVAVKSCGEEITSTQE